MARDRLGEGRRKHIIAARHSCVAVSQGVAVPADVPEGPSRPASDWEGGTSQQGASLPGPSSLLVHHLGDALQKGPVMSPFILANTTSAWWWPSCLHDQAWGRWPRHLALILPFPCQYGNSFLYLMQTSAGIGQQERENRYGKCWGEQGLRGGSQEES